jgi:hypothetical protein
MTDEQIKHMTERFLSWRLPEHFNPDAGISFDPVFNKGSQYEKIGAGLQPASAAAKPDAQSPSSFKMGG